MVATWWLPLAVLVFACGASASDKLAPTTAATADVPINSSSSFSQRAIDAARYYIVKPFDNSATLTEKIMKHYLSHGLCGRKDSIMVCKSCATDGLQGLSWHTTDQGYDVWCFDTGTIWNTGEGGYENWYFGGCFDRSGDDGLGKRVTFKKCRGRYYL